ncbi:MAG: choice-of-anchor V domain-containing protein [Blastocatellia bacterium]
MFSTRNIGRSLKLLLLGISFIVVVLTSLYSERTASAFSTGAPTGRTNAPGETNCTACHTSFALNSGPGMLTLSGVPDTYTAGTEYTITVRITHPDPPATVRYGFSITAIDDAGRAAGTFILTDSAGTQIRTAAIAGNTRNYVTHTATGSATPAPATDQREWTLKWVAPSSVIGRVGFYLASNRANGGATNQGDYIYSASKNTLPAQPALSAVSVSAASFRAASPVTVDGVVSAFGTRLATGSAVGGDINPNLPGVQLPTILAGTTVLVRDTNGVERHAPLFFVSPTQVNYVVPAGTALGVATVTIMAGDNTISGGSIQVSRTGPGIFTLNGAGSGAPAGYIIRVRDNQQLTEPLAQLSNGVWSTLPIDLGPDTDQLFLVLFGTGFRNRQALTGVTATIGGTASEVLFADAHSVFVGVDQINLRIPRTVTRDEIDVILTAEGVAGNAIRLRFRP